jgi:ElaB/YqjD/DUF883 family membrane-anchored ribosome-binding protein
MIRWFSRALVLIYIAMPVAAVLLGISAVRSIGDELRPILDNASDRIASAADGLEDEMEDLRSNFQPLVNAISRVRSALSTIRNFVNNSINRVIDIINRAPGVNIPQFAGIDLPELFDANFLSDISEHVRDLTRGVDDYFSGIGDFFNEQSTAITLMLVLLGAWLLLGYVLGAVVIVRSLWH